MNLAPSPHKPRVLFICGSVNQTSQLHQVAAHLPEFRASFSPFYVDFPTDLIRRFRLAEATIMGFKRRGWCLEYLEKHNLAVDVGGERGPYDLVVTCTDLVIPKNVRGLPLVVVQEGIFDPPGLVHKLVSRFRFLPPWLSGTSMTGTSPYFDRFCVASEGYRDHMVRMGADPKKIVVTGIPNFDDCKRYRNNLFPHKGYVLACTSDTRETFKFDPREAFVTRVRDVARGRQVIFKLHPNENYDRERRIIQRIIPEALVLQKGSAEEMIANAEVVLTQWSSTVFVALALGKEVYSNFPREEIVRLCPLQNDGTSAEHIAAVCRDLAAQRGIPAQHAAPSAASMHAHGAP